MKKQTSYFNTRLLERYYDQLYYYNFIVTKLAPEFVATRKYTPVFPKVYALVEKGDFRLPVRGLKASLEFFHETAGAVLATTAFFKTNDPEETVNGVKRAEFMDAYNNMHRFIEQNPDAVKSNYYRY